MYGLTRWSDTKSVWSGARWMTTVFLVWRTTGKGPMYLGVSGGFMASTRT